LADSPAEKIPGRYVLVLHGHIPDVMGHGTWPHGEDWLYEAAVGSYLPLVELLDRLHSGGIPSRMTVGLTPVLIAQFSDPRFHDGLVKYLHHRILAAGKDEKEFHDTGDRVFARLAGAWRMRFEHLERLYLERCGGDILSVLREAADRGQIEIMSSAATHGYLPLLPSEASIRAQVGVGVATSRRFLGRNARSFWMPECAYRPAGLWFPPWGGRSFRRPGVESYLEEKGIDVTIVDSHLIGAERAPSVYGGEGSEMWLRGRTPLRPYQVADRNVKILVREPEISLYVWSGQFGYPGGPHYLDFHKKRDPGGLRYWRVTDAKKGMGGKEPYDPAAIGDALAKNSTHFVSMVRERLLQEGERLRGRATLTTPFDLELFGHWWYEGVSWLERVFVQMHEAGIETAFASEAADLHPDAEPIRLPEGSWGAGGDHRVWWNEETRSYWEWLVRGEKDLKALALEAGDRVPPAIQHAIVRQLLILQASDWPFSIRQGTSIDYAEARIEKHAGDLRRLIQIGRRAAGGAALTKRQSRFLARIEARDPLFHVDDLPPITNWAEPKREAVDLVSRPIRIAMLSAECAPFAKVGGLADVVGALPAALRRAGAEVRVVIPLHGELDRGSFGIEAAPAELLRISDTGEPFVVRRLRGNGLGDVDFIDIGWAFGRGGIYAGHDDFARYLAFCRAALDSLFASGFRPDVIHLHDHQMAPALQLLRTTGRGAALGNPGTVFTIHNLGHQGVYEFDDWLGSALPPESIAPRGPFEFLGDVNLMKGAISLADRLTTVSPRYAKEIATIPKYGEKLDGLLRVRREDLAGILNGIDMEAWNPETDPLIAANYGARDLTNKKTCRMDLLKRVGLEDPGPKVPVFGSISRLAPQKGIDRIVQALPSLLREPGVFVFLGSGEAALERALAGLASRFPDRVAFFGGSNEELAHKIEAGADFFLMPSRYEPCGLNQMYSLRYGTVPIVRETGGLADTVIDIGRDRSLGNGISYKIDSAAALVKAVQRASRLYADRRRMAAVRRRGMRGDFSWDSAARKYLNVYQSAAEAARWD